ncbi:MAG: guanylate kinase [Thermodesulfovibrionales bacterium]
MVSAPSGAGKTTLCQRLTADLRDIRHSVSYTTRKPRPNEVNDRDYSFVSEEDFRRMAAAGEFAEWAEVHGNLYGTSVKRVEEMLEGGVDAILDVDTRGAAQLRKVYRDGVFVFILPPSMRALRERLTARMSDSAEEIERRLKRARDEIRDYRSYDYVIVNDVFEAALRELEAIVTAKRLESGSVDPEWVDENFLLEEDV